jgi:hypothetical protein
MTNKNKTKQTNKIQSKEKKNSRKSRKNTFVVG